MLFHCYVLTIVVRVGNHGRLPLSIQVLVPILWLGGIRIWNVLGLVPILYTNKGWNGLNHIHCSIELVLFSFSFFEFLLSRRIHCICRNCYTGPCLVSVFPVNKFVQGFNIMLTRLIFLKILTTYIPAPREGHPVWIRVINGRTFS